MRFARFSAQGNTYFAILKDKKLNVIDGDIFGDYKVTDKVFDLDKVKILAPVEPSKIVAIGLNYKKHADELGSDVPKDPVLFLKPTTTIIADGEEIIIPKMSQRVDYEAELAIVIGKTCKNVCEKEALSYVFGYTCLNDVTARDLQKIDSQWTRAKCFDTFCPIGPYIVNDTDIDPDNLKIRSVLNGEIRQDSCTCNFIWNSSALISYISKIMTLNPGDVVTTGTPVGIGKMKDGDEIKIEIEKIGTLTNYVKE